MYFLRIKVMITYVAFDSRNFNDSSFRAGALASRISQLEIIRYTATIKTL